MIGRKWVLGAGALLVGVVTLRGCGGPPSAPLVHPVPVSAAEPARGPAGTFPRERIDVRGKQREYRLVVPRSVDPKKPAPLLFAFHGLLDSKDLMPLYSQLDRLAEREKFILAYPNAQNKYWPLVPDWAKDDLAFFDALCDRLTSRYRVDADRVYLAGMSNGPTSATSWRRCAPTRSRRSPPTPAGSARWPSARRRSSGSTRCWLSTAAPTPS
jgi:hypothetical protein